MKRGKVLITLATTILCLGLLVFGVYSAVTVDFAFGGTLNFSPEGVFVDIKGQVYRGEDYLNLEAIEGDEFTFNATNYDDSTGVTSGNFPINSWNPEVAFLPAKTFIQYYIEITNVSSESISAIPSDMAAISDVTVWQNCAEILRIDPGETAKYELNLEYTGTASISNVSFNINFDIRTTSAYIEAQNALGANGISITQEGGVIQSVSGKNNTTDTSLANCAFIPSTINGTAITATKDTTASAQYFLTTAKYIIFETGIKTLGSYTFIMKSGVEAISLPNSLTTIGNAVFGSCSAISINIPSSVTSLGTSAFAGAIKAVVVPGSIKDIPSSCFGSAHNLIKVEIEYGVETIGSGAFNTCAKLEEVILPETITQIAANAFTLTQSALETFIIKATTPPELTANILGSATPKIYVPDSSLEEYKAANIWSNYSSYIYPMSLLPN